MPCQQINQVLLLSISLPAKSRYRGYKWYDWDPRRLKTLHIIDSAILTVPVSIFLQMILCKGRNIIVTSNDAWKFRILCKYLYILKYFSSSDSNIYILQPVLQPVDWAELLWGRITSFYGHVISPMSCAIPEKTIHAAQRFIYCPRRTNEPYVFNWLSLNPSKAEFLIFVLPLNSIVLPIIYSQYHTLTCWFCSQSWCYR